MTSSLQLQQRTDGTAVPVRVVPRGGRTRIDGLLDGNMRVRLAAPPVDGAANKELIAFMARIFGVPKRDVELLQGEKSRMKLLLIRGVTPEYVTNRLAMAGLETLSAQHEHRERGE